MNAYTKPLEQHAKEVTFDAVTLGKTIKRLREERGLTQTELGNLSSLSAAEISKLESGLRKKLPRDTLVKISPHLNVSVDYLLIICTEESSGDYEHFYDFSGTEINLYKTSKKMYYADAEFLILISSEQFLKDKDFINFLKSWIKIKNKLDEHLEKTSFQIFKIIFDDLKNYCLSIIQRLNETLN